ncbi:hypothetical protein [Secundilactobacillus paracollinoides]|nr:hypothetical protein [Secundilactobacillus paracollinoides]
MQNELINIWEKTGKTILFVTHDIQEAAYLGQKISIFSKSPESRISITVSVDQSYPRNLYSNESEQLVNRINDYFEVGGPAK